MEINSFIGLRTIMLLSLFFAPSVLAPELSPNVISILLGKWRHYKARISAMKKKCSSTPGKHFWEIDMTKFEP